MNGWSGPWQWRPSLGRAEGGSGDDRRGRYDRLRVVRFAVSGRRVVRVGPRRAGVVMDRTAQAVGWFK